MTPHERAGKARALLADPMFDEIFSGLEQGCIDRAINAGPTDHETRLAELTKARAIRTLRGQLRSIIEQDEAKPDTKGSFA